MLKFAVFALAIAASDQLLKLWVCANIPLFELQSFLPGVLSLTNIRNRGAAFSSLSGMQWLFALVFLLFTAAMFWEYYRRPMPFQPAERWCIAAIWGGGLGNMIDRVRLGYVVDMFHTDFLDFAIFNIADCFITCGCIFFAIHLFFCNHEIWRDNKP